MPCRRFSHASVWLVALLLAAPAAFGSSTATDELTPTLRGLLAVPVRQKVEQIYNSTNADGVHNRRATYSRDFHKLDENTYRTTMHVGTADATTVTTERIELTLKRDSPKSDRWYIADETVKDTVQALHREAGYNCYPFEKFRFDREGMRMTGSNGWMCELYYQGDVAEFSVAAPDLAYEYAPPTYVDDTHPALYKFLMVDKQSEVVFTPQAFMFNCDAASCEELIGASFTGLTRVEPAARKPDAAGAPSGVDPRALEMMNKAVDINLFGLRIVSRTKERKEHPFFDFRIPYQPGNRFYRAIVYGNDSHALYLDYDNWGGYEVTLNIFQDTTDTEAMNGLIFGYYTQQTYEKFTPYELERRDDREARWHEVQSISGNVDMALDDPELLAANIDFGLVAKHDLTQLEFAIQSIPQSVTSERRELYVNSIQYQDQELTWVRTSPISGVVFFPEPVAKGTLFHLNVDFTTRALYKVNHAYTAMSRFGWMPFVRFADFIDEFELVIRSPAQYDILGIGHKVAERREGDVLVSEWRSDSPVVFPTIIFGRYNSDTPRIKATKADGTEIPVTVHVDEVSMHQLAIDPNLAEARGGGMNSITSGARGIRGKQLRPIAEQAVNAINLYREVSGIDYPYGELNLVNDPAPALYGQAPSSLIYLGSLVFRGEGTMAGDTWLGGGGTSVSKFLKSVVAHEVGHQWWGSSISNANQRNYWFVETLAEYFSALYLEAVYGDKEYQEQVDEWRRRVIDVDQKVSVQNASTHWGGNFPGAAYQAAVYNKGPYMFHMLRETFGDEKFLQYLKQFSLEMAGLREIVSRDIQNSSEKHLGGIGPDGNPYTVDLEWFFDQWLRGAGLPQYRLEYNVRQAESGEWIVEGVIYQRVVVGNSRQFHVLEGTNYSGVVDLTAVGRKGQEYRQRVIVRGDQTPFRVTVPDRPLEVSLNKYGEMLALDTKVNQAW